VLEGHVREGALLRGEHPIEAPLDQARRGGERRRIADEGSRRPAKHVARELVEHDDQRKCGERCGPPPLELPTHRLLPQREKAPADLGVEGIGLAEPDLARAPALA